MESITCPGCQKAIRVPPDVLGQRAQCPFCKCHFRAPIRTADGITEPVLLRRNPFGNRRVLPGMMLLLIGLIGFVTNAFQAIKAYSDPQAFEEQTRESFERAAEQSNTPEIRDKIPMTVEWLPRVRVVSAVLSLVTIAGAIAMLRARRHGLAMLGSIVAMLNIANVVNCCCFASVLVGGWSLMVLLDPNVRAEFGRPEMTTPPA
ncbi:MAG TPA: hypothetical protein VKD71_14050 [Gemmataceae bacterium]|nr:hypothetical protein [Gemmataceae bacterium]